MSHRDADAGPDFLHPSVWQARCRDEPGHLTGLSMGWVGSRIGGCGDAATREAVNE